VLDLLPASGCRAAKKLSFSTTVIRKLKLVFKIAFALFGLLLLLAAAAFCFPQQFLTVDSGTVQADVIVVLGGGVHERPVRVAELFKEHAAPRIIVTGYGDDGYNRWLLTTAGIPAGVIEVEGKSTTTRENAKFTIKLLREQKLNRVIIVTSWYHSRRALACFEHYAPEIKFYSRPSYFAFARAEWKPKGIAREVRREYEKLPGYWICYGVWPF
jgi:uncharacterized SAM-binding protein YcdF (DUF218 family)